MVDESQLSWVIWFCCIVLRLQIVHVVPRLYTDCTQIISKHIFLYSIAVVFYRSLEILKKHVCRNCYTHLLEYHTIGIRTLWMCVGGAFKVNFIKVSLNVRDFFYKTQWRSKLKISGWMVLRFFYDSHWQSSIVAIRQWYTMR